MLEQPGVERVRVPWALRKSFGANKTKRLKFFFFNSRLMWDLSSWTFSCVSMRKCCWPSASGRWRQLAKILKSWVRKSDKGGWVMQVVENNGCISSNSTHAWLLGCTSRDFKWTVVGKQFKIEIVPQLALIVFWISMKVHLQQLKNFILVFDVSLSRWVIVLLKLGHL